jgi:hypothetical protein
MKRGVSMRSRVYYMSQKGWAEAVAEAVAGAVGCPMESLLPAYMPENLELMFLGCEGLRADRVTLSFIESLNPSRAKRAALFHCGAGRGEALAQMRGALTIRGIAVLEDAFSAPMRGILGRGPTPAQLEDARAFARAALKAAGRA